MLQPHNNMEKERLQVRDFRSVHNRQSMQPGTHSWLKNHTRRSLMKSSAWATHWKNLLKAVLNARLCWQQEGVWVQCRECGSSRVSALGRSPTWSLQEGSCLRSSTVCPKHPRIHSTLPKHTKSCTSPWGSQLPWSVQGPGKWGSVYWWQGPNNSGGSGVVTTRELYRLLTAGSGWQIIVENWDSGAILPLYCISLVLSYVLLPQNPKIS